MGMPAVRVRAATHRREGGEAYRLLDGENEGNAGGAQRGEQASGRGERDDKHDAHALHYMHRGFHLQYFIGRLFNITVISF